MGPSSPPIKFLWELLTEILQILEIFPILHVLIHVILDLFQVEIYASAVVPLFDLDSSCELWLFKLGDHCIETEVT